MKAEDLIKLALLHGTDLRHTFESASNTDGVAQQRRYSRDERKQRMEEHLGLTVEPSVRGRGSQVSRRPNWTADDFGIAAGGNLAPEGKPPKYKMPRMPYLALLHSTFGDRTHYVELHRRLQVTAFRLADKDRWPYLVTLANGQREYYIERLGALVLDADAHAWVFAKAPDLYAWYMDVDPETWLSLLFGRYHSLRVEYLAAVSIGLRILQRWINEPFDALPDPLPVNPDFVVVDTALDPAKKAPACAEA